jgi:hypothetical protein
MRANAFKFVYLKKRFQICLSYKNAFKFVYLKKNIFERIKMCALYI